jgi:UDP-N-acetylmuramoylalanine--D-glutamate ligase
MPASDREIDRTSRDLEAAAWPLRALGLPGPRSGPRVAVLGLKRSGLAAARLLLERGCRVDLLDLKPPEAETDRLDELVERRARIRLGPHDPAWLEECDLIVKSPGVDRRIPFLREAGAKGIPVIGELELAWLATRGAVVAITGTNGKSTTTAWVGDMTRRDARPVEVVGNIGRPFSQGVLEHPDATFVVEVSSFQLEDAPTFRPKVAALLNLTPDHLDRHETFEAYRKAKLSIFSRQGSGDAAVLPGEGELAALRPAAPSVRLVRFGTGDPSEDGCHLRGGDLWLRDAGSDVRLLLRERISLPGPHNLANAAAAAATAMAAGVSPGSIAASLAEFPGLPHRLEPVGEIEGVRFVNDSKATNVGSLAVALRSFPGRVVLIAGGRGKGQDFAPLLPLVQKKVAALFLIGDDAKRLRSAWKAVESQVVGNLAEATRRAFAAARPEGVVLLSPGCASFDMFRDFEDRGDQFREQVRALAETRGKESGNA